MVLTNVRAKPFAFDDWMTMTLSWGGVCDNQDVGLCERWGEISHRTVGGWDRFYVPILRCYKREFNGTYVFLKRACVSGIDRDSRQSSQRKCTRIERPEIK